MCSSILAWFAESAERVDASSQPMIAIDHRVLTYIHSVMYRVDPVQSKFKLAHSNSTIRMLADPISHDTSFPLIALPTKASPTPSIEVRHLAC